MSCKRYPYGNDFWPISLWDLNIILGAWNGFSGNLLPAYFLKLRFLKIRFLVTWLKGLLVNYEICKNTFFCIRSLYDCFWLWYKKLSICKLLKRAVQVKKEVSEALVCRLQTSCFHSSPLQKPVRLSAINTRFSWKKVFAAVKIEKQSSQVFCKRKTATLLKRGSSNANFFKNTYFERRLWTTASENQCLSDKFAEGG